MNDTVVVECAGCGARCILLDPGFQEWWEAHLPCLRDKYAGWPDDEQHAIACLSCGAADHVRSDDERAIQWPAWEPGPHEGFCPRCGGTAWATEPRKVGELRAEAER